MAKKSAATVLLIVLLVGGVAYACSRDFRAPKEQHKNARWRNSGNRPPTAAINANDVVDEGGPLTGISSITVDALDSSDPDGKVVAWSWEVTSGPGKMTNDVWTWEVATYVPPDKVDRDTTATIELTVTDDDGATDSDTADVTVLDSWNSSEETSFSEGENAE